MEAKIIKTDLAEYQPAVFSGTNESGIEPVGDKILVLPDNASPKTRGGIVLPEDIVERQALQAVTGVIVALGGAAFFWNSDRTRPWEGEKPQVGDHVCMERYSGVVFPGNDGQKYRVMNDTCIAAIRKEPLQQQTEGAQS